MKNKLTRKLMLSAFTLLFAVISLGASTYAWFVLSEDATINAFQGTVAAGTSGLEIQVTTQGENPVDAKWSATSISSDLIQDVIGDSVAFSALQKNALTSDNKFSTQKQVIEEKTGTVTANIDYVVFDVHFRLSDADKDATGTTTLYLSQLLFNTEESEDPQWNAAKSYLEDTGLKSGGTIPQGPLADPYFVQDAARVAFVYEGAEKYVYEATEGSEHYTAGHNNDKGAIDYFNKVNEVTEEDDDYIKVPTGYYTPTQLEENALLAQIPNNGDYATVTVYVWIEGWDNECINDIFNQILKVSMTFTISESTEESDETDA